MRGVVPIGVTAPRGATSVMLSPACRDNLRGGPAADRNALPFVEPLERALLDVLGDRGEVVEIVGANAANQYARGIERRGCQRLAIYDRRGKANARDLVDALGDILPVGQRRFQRLHQEMAIKAEN